MRLLLTIILLLLSTQAKAGFSLGVSTMYFNDDLHYNNEKFRPSLAVGWLETFDKWNIGLYTTRLNHSQKRSLKNGLDVKSKIDSDILHVGYEVNRYIPNIILTNTQVKTTISDQSFKENLIAYGFGVDYLLTKNITVGILVIPPIKIGHGFSFNSTEVFLFLCPPCCLLITCFFCKDIV